MTEILTGIGLALVPIRLPHMYIASAGTAILICVVALTLRKRNLVLGSKYIYIPLTVITLLALFSDCTLPEKLMSIVLLGLYVVGVNSSQNSTKLLGPAVLIGCVSVVIYSLALDSRTGGIYCSFNPNIAVGAIVMGTVLFRSRWQWILATTALAGLCFTGAEEAFVVIAILGLTILVRRDWSSRLLVLICVLAIGIALCVPLGVTQQVWSNTSLRIEGIAQNDLEVATNGRWEVWNDALRNVKPLGHGYNPFDVSHGSVHNVPLRILYELGPIACIAWLWIMGYGIIKTRAKYIFVAILALSLFDHFIWTQICTYTYFAIGASATINSDLIFKKGGEV